MDSASTNGTFIGSCITSVWNNCDSEIYSLGLDLKNTLEDVNTTWRMLTSEVKIHAAGFRKGFYIPLAGLISQQIRQDTEV